jgi:hypothetical protein
MDIHVTVQEILPIFAFLGYAAAADEIFRRNIP